MQEILIEKCEHEFKILPDGNYVCTKCSHRITWYLGDELRFLEGIGTYGVRMLTLRNMTRERKDQQIKEWRKEALKGYIAAHKNASGWRLAARRKASEMLREIR